MDSVTFKEWQHNVHEKKERACTYVFRRKANGKLDFYVKGRLNGRQLDPTSAHGGLNLLVTDLISVELLEGRIRLDGTSRGFWGSKWEVVPCGNAAVRFGDRPETGAHVLALYSGYRVTPLE